MKAPKFNIDNVSRKRSAMFTNNHDSNKWKREQLEYFKRYLDSFHINSREYNLILKGIQDLEKSL